jgi:hypothetical protein
MAVVSLNAYVSRPDLRFWSSIPLAAISIWYGQDHNRQGMWTQGRLAEQFPSSTFDKKNGCCGREGKLLSGNRGNQEKEFLIL